MKKIPKININELTELDPSFTMKTSRYPSIHNNINESTMYSPQMSSMYKSEAINLGNPMQQSMQRRYDNKL